MPRRGVSPVDAKWPLSMEDVPIGQPVTGHAAAAETVSATLDWEGPREGVKGGPSKTRARGRQGRQRSSTRVGSAENIPSTISSLEQGRVWQRQSGVKGVRVHPLPRPRGGPQSLPLLIRRKPGGSTGNPRVRVLVVESLGSRHRTNVSDGARPTARCKARRRGGCLA